MNLFIQIAAGILGGLAAALVAREHSFGVLGHTLAGALGGACSGYFLQTLAGTVVTGSGAANDSDAVSAVILQALSGLAAGAIVTLVVGFLKHSIDQHRAGIAETQTLMSSATAGGGLAPALGVAAKKQEALMVQLVDKKVFNVLFICTGNSARSIIAEAALNRAGQGRFRGFSAGSHPKGAVHPYALDLLRRMNFDVSQMRSKSWTEFSGADAPKLDFAFTLCDDAAAETCPVWPGQPMTAHWGLPDPAAAAGNEAEVRFAFADTLRMITNRINIFVSLPIKSLDQLALQKQLDAIGKVKAAPADPAKAAG